MTTPADGTSAGFAVAAYGTAWTSTSPPYKRLDSSPVQVVTGFTTRRGRSYMLDSMDTGTASIQFIDTQGYVDPTCTTGPFYPMNPNAPMKLRLWNPVTAAWGDVFTGFTQSCPQALNLSSNVSTGTIECKDLFDMLAMAEIPPGIDYADDGTPTDNTDGNTRFASQTQGDHMTALAELAAVPSAMYAIFTGNVLTTSIVYGPGTKILAALMDGADAEFPGVAIVYVDKTGLLTSHGRLARFDPSSYGAHTWNTGDLPYCAGGSGRIPLTGLSFDRDIEKIINAALYTPDGVDPADIAGNLVDDLTSIDAYGQRGETGQGIYTAGGVPTGDGLNGLEECAAFGTYYVTNFKDAQTHATSVTIKSIPATAPFAGDLWNMLCNIEIGDVVNITTTHPGGGGFSAVPHFVEGLSYDVGLGVKYPGDDEATADVSLQIDLSPQAYWTTPPAGWT